MFDDQENGQSEQDPGPEPETGELDSDGPPNTDITEGADTDDLQTTGPPNTRADEAEDDE